MKKLLNTVYVTTEGAALRKDSETLVAEIEGAEKSRVPLHMLASVVAFGPVLLTPAMIGACAERGITVALLDRAGRFQARIEGATHGNVLLRRAQYKAADTYEDIVRSIVLGKIANQDAVLRGPCATMTPPRWKRPVTAWPNPAPGSIDGKDHRPVARIRGRGREPLLRRLRPSDPVARRRAALDRPQPPPAAGGDERAFVLSVNPADP